VLDFAVAYNIRNIPILVVFKNGEEITRQAEVMGYVNLVRYIAVKI
jgi:hypothetical protein